MGQTFSRPRVCVTVSADTTAELRRRRDEVHHGDLVELRLDTVRDPDIHGALAGRPRPVVITCRAAWEGGHFRGSEDERIRLLTAAWDAGAEFVDIEAAAPAASAFLERTAGRRVVLSMHDFGGVPSDLEERAGSLARTPAEIVKIAVTPTRLSDTLPLFALADLVGSRKFIALAMGSAGVPTRLLAARIGSHWSYAGQGWVPGQMPAERLLGEFRFQSVTAQTVVYGVLGNPIAHSLSPAMHNAAFEAEALDAVYVPLEAADAADFLTFADGIGLAGVSVTAPFKRAFEGVARLDAHAERAGALNTLKRASDGWEATNTDIEGFLTPLEPRLALKGIRAAVLGAGGAARAVAIALHGRGARVTLHARRFEQAREAAEALGVHHAAWPPAAGTWDLLVNATPVGTAPRDDTPLPNAEFDGRLVYDLVYNPPLTRLLREAATATSGCATLGGLEMLVAQAARQFHWWTGRQPNVEVMRRAALRRLAADRASQADQNVMVDETYATDDVR
jgi:3-dehydroquinate dehydratase/shikimate dehydrogenase